jgi:glycosyltransferase involved in cell wall biosynthesis
MSSVRVCAITYDNYPFDILVRRTAEAAVRAGYEYHVICAPREEQEKYEVCSGVHVHRLPMQRLIGRSLGSMVLSWIVFTILAMGKVARLHLKHKFNVIHVHNMPDFLVFSALIPRLFGAKVILEVQDVSPELMAAKAKGRLRDIILAVATWQERISTAFADHVLTVGWPFEEILLKRGVPPKKLSSVLNSADPNLYPIEKRTEPLAGPATAERPLILMYHGTLAERNGLDTAIRAFAKARETAPYLRLDIQGRGEALPYLKHLAQELGVSDHMTFTGYAPSEDLVDFVTHGDVGIIPYRSDGFMDLVLPTKAYEFALMHRPMIASSTPAIRSMFRPESLILCVPSNVDDFAEAIVDLYLHPEKRAQLIANAEQDYEPYRWEIMAKRYQMLLASLGVMQRKHRSAWHLSDSNS